MKFIKVGIVILMVLVFTSLSVLAQDAGLYEDPAGRFTVPMPSDWANESTSDVARFISPDGIQVSIIAVEAADATAGSPLVLSALAPELVDAVPVQSSVESFPNGVWSLSIYAPAADRFILLGMQSLNGLTYGLMFDMPGQDVFTAHRAEVINQIAEFSAGNRLDLTGVAPQVLTADKLAELEAYVESALQTFHVPGASIAIVQNGAVIYANGFGTTDPNGGQPVTAETLVMVGSLTKSMTTMMMGTLVDEGILDWDTPVTDILPSFALSVPEATAQISVRDLVNMSSGVPAYDNILSLGQLTPQELIASIAEIPLVAAPGEMYNYNNQMVTTGGFLSALVTGSPMDALYEGYIDLIQKRIFDPIVMPATTFDFDVALGNPNHALPFTYDPITQTFVNAPLGIEKSVRNMVPAGGVWSNANDMARYLLTVVNAGVSPDGVRVISEATLRTTQTKEVTIVGSAGYGMGWDVLSYNSLPLILHEGNTGGFTSTMAFLPDADLGVMVVANAGDANDFRLSVREHVFELAFGLDHDSANSYAAAHEAQLQSAVQTAEALQAFTPDTSINANSETVAPYLGTYEYAIKVEMRGDELWFAGPYIQSPLYPADGIPGMEAGDYTGLDSLAGIRVRFVETGDLVTLEMMSLFNGETLTFDKVQ